MKKILFFLFTCLTTNVHCMEQQQPVGAEFFGNSPDVLIEHLFSFIPEATSSREILQKIGGLSLVNSTFRKIAGGKVLLNELVKRYIRFYPRKAKQEFSDAAGQILKGAKECDKIITILAPHADTTILNQVLHEAIHRGNKRLVKLLLGSDIDVNAENQSGQTPLIHASLFGRKAMVRLFIAFRADVNAVDKEGATALIHASKKSYAEIVVLLLDNDAHVDAIDKRSQTALMFASGFGFKEIATLLLHAGAEINHANERGRTALHLAAVNGRKETAELLLAFGADVHFLNNEGETAIMEATYRGHKEVAQLLRDNGAFMEVVVPSVKSIETS